MSSFPSAAADPNCSGAQTSIATIVNALQCYLLCICKCLNSGVGWDFQKITEQHTCGILGTSTSNGGVVVCPGVHCS